MTTGIRLSSYQRIRRYYAPDSAGPHGDEMAFRREVENWITTVSRAIERYLDRDLLTAQYTEYLDTAFRQRVFYPKATPVTTLTSAYSDPDGLWDGGESEVTDAFVGVDGATVVLQSDLGVVGPKALRVIYTGGMAYSGTQSVFTVTDATAFTAGKFVSNADYSALGIVISGSTTSLTVDNLYGVFAVGDVLTEYTYADDVDDATAPTSATGASDTISAVAQQSLAESEWGDIVRAAEMQIGYYIQHKGQYEMVGSTREGVNLRSRPTRTAPPLPFTNEVYSMLRPLRRMVVQA